jgi:hypothetical protein
MAEVLELNALVEERPQARIKTPEDPEGTLYNLLVPEEIGTVDLARLSRLYVEHDELWEKETRSAAEDKRLEKLSLDLTQALIPDAPAASIKALGAVTKRGLAVRFFVSAGLASKEALGQLASNLANSSQGSPASTEETPPAG